LPSFSLIFLIYFLKILLFILPGSYGTFKKLLLLFSTAFKKPFGHSFVLVSFRKPTYVKSRRYCTPELHTIITSAHPQKHTRETVRYTSSSKSYMTQDRRAACHDFYVYLQIQQYDLKYCRLRTHASVSLFCKSQETQVWTIAFLSFACKSLMGLGHR